MDAACVARVWHGDSVSVQFFLRNLADNLAEVLLCGYTRKCENVDIGCHLWHGDLVSVQFFS